MPSDPSADDSDAACATAIMPEFTSLPDTRPEEPAACAAARVAKPVPHATSSTRSPGDTAAATSSSHNGDMKRATCSW